MLHYQTLTVRASLEVIRDVNQKLLEAKLRYVMHRLPGLGLLVKGNAHVHLEGVVLDTISARPSDAAVRSGLQAGLPGGSYGR
jgi:hypothetical protein